ncbi:cytochrome P450, family 714, subfamily A, polypeptide 1, EUI-like p450 A1 [Hibiscus trionum]|uniref:Cytochrome P450, family 714, subfamily A, polypeptide 1, EUI-like p450 A1 n=1 Tax=Hibiscus trionum TaxID=183268 RepID=A0A9W7HBC1_HIBTR|nr:cytochrome P450, family 714, subfamily A, polypeptide 1, EUI-like p450 A1 [Hibiscus trionum]
MDPTSMEEGLDLMLKLVSSVVLAGFLGLLLHFYNAVLLKPNKLRLKLQNQGVRGPSPSFFYGNIHEMTRIKLEAQSAQKDVKAAISHDWFPTLFPFLDKWRNQYGSVFLYSTGHLQLLCTTDLEMVKEIGLHKSLSLGKPSYLTKDRGPLLGQGILSSSGPIWAHQRKIIAPNLFPDKVKSMVNLMVDATISMLKSWESRVEGEGGISEILVDEDLRCLSADIISRACFGSDYSQGEEIFSNLNALQLAMSKPNIGVPGMRYLPTKNNREIWKLEKAVDTLISSVVNRRIKEATTATHDRDLLQMILDGADDFKGLSKERFIVDNCKSMYFAGYETTATTASWTLMLLAAYPDWQARVRAEVLEACKGGLPDANALRNMKKLTMVIQETLRLYPPATFAIRQALEDIDFKGITIPKDMNIQIPIPALQQSLDLWGPDAHQFNPERFANGIAEASKVPQAYMPFGIGARICAGQHFAMAELKVVLSLLVSKFCFSLSPAYHHSPAFRLVIQPQHGVCLLVERV